MTKATCAVSSLISMCRSNVNTRQDKTRATDAIESVLTAKSLPAKLEEQCRMSLYCYLPRLVLYRALIRSLLSTLSNSSEDLLMQIREHTETINELLAELEMVNDTAKGTTDDYDDELAANEYATRSIDVADTTAKVTNWLYQARESMNAFGEYIKMGDATTTEGHLEEEDDQAFWSDEHSDASDFDMQVARDDGPIMAGPHRQQHQQPPQSYGGPSDGRSEASAGQTLRRLSMTDGGSSAHDYDPDEREVVVGQEGQPILYAPLICFYPVRAPVIRPR